MEKGCSVKIISLERVESTQIYLKEQLREGKLFAPCAVVTTEQSSGIGSRGNSWSGIKGNLFFSFALSPESLALDLKLESASIYFSYLLKEILEEKGSQIWLKWPNDFYIGEKKIGGTITHIVQDKLVCGIGLNLIEAPTDFDVLDINISNINLLLEEYFEKIEKKISWKQVFSKYELEFYKSKKFLTHKSDMVISLDDAELLSDGSIFSNGERIFSTR